MSNRAECLPAVLQVLSVSLHGSVHDMYIQHRLISKHTYVCTCMYYIILYVGTYVILRMNVSSIRMYENKINDNCI